MQTQIMRRSTHTAARTGVLATAAFAALTITPAHAGDGGDAIANYQSAQQVLTTGKVQETVSRFLVAARADEASGAADGGMGASPENGPEAAGAAPGFDLKDPVPMYEISREFVTGEAKGDPEKALRLSFLASRVTVSDGRKAAVLLSPKGASAGAGGPAAGSEGWQLAGIQSGDEELARAESGTSQAPTFTEPQIHAWYRLTDKGMVEPLNKEARTGLDGKDSLPLADYQELVNKRYGDKLPGSEYDRKGMAGGYAGLTEAGESAQPELAEPAPFTDAPWQSAALAGGLMVVGGVIYARRRRTVTEH